jgi:hypothetical protein
MKLATLTHANLKTPIWVDLDLLGAWFYSETNKATHLILIAGAMMPVLESCEEIAKLKQKRSPENEQRSVRPRRS